MRPVSHLLAACLLLLAFPAEGGRITLAAASDLKFAMDEIVAAFRDEHPADTVEVIYGSSGRFQTQIRRGAPYDLYFSADIAFPRALADAGLAASPVLPYAWGRIVLWSARLDAAAMTLASLAEPGVGRIAIANPRHAPYGQRAMEALQAAGVLGQVQPKLVYGESIAHAAQFVQTGNADVGIIALSLALGPALSGAGGYWLVPESLHEPLEQGFIVTARAGENPLAWRFVDFMGTAAAREIMRRYGFVLPGEAVDD